MIPLCCCPTNVAPTPTSTPSAFSAVLTNAAATTTTTSTTTVTHKTNNIHKIKLMDIFLMALIHCLLFFIYAHHHSHSYYSRLLPARHDDTTATNDFLRQQLDRFKKGRSHDNNNNNNNKNNDSNNNNDKINNNHIIHYEPNYPKLTRLHEFPTAASEKEMAKHDRYMIHSILYTEMLSQEYLYKHWKLPDNRKRGGPWRFEKKVCMTVRINNNNNNNKKQKNGKLPYVHALIMSLMGGHVQGEYREGLNKIVPAGHRLLSFVDLNLLRVDGRTQDGKEEDLSDNDEDDEDDIQKKVWNLNFVKVHDIQHRHGYGKTTTTTTARTNYNSRKLEKIIQILESARICVESELPWCLVMEEYTVVSIEFLNSLKRFVISPLESFAASHRTDATESDGEVFRRKKKMSVISLFSAYNTETASVMRVHDVEYSRNQYERDRGKINSERKALGLEEYQFQYEMYPIVEKGTSSNGGGGGGDDDDNSLKGGFDTAMLFHTSMVQSDLIPMLERMKRQEERRIAMERFKGFFGLSHGGQGVVEQPLDIEREFSLYTGIKRYRVEPSLVNRIGFYDPDFIWNGNDEFVQTSKLGITNWLTDPRFVFEPGEYYEGIDEYCEMDDGTWIWDALHDHRRKSCCDEKFAKDERCLEDE
jgi:hypothetical protein